MVVDGYNTLDIKAKDGGGKEIAPPPQPLHQPAKINSNQIILPQKQPSNRIIHPPTFHLSNKQRNDILKRNLNYRKQQRNKKIKQI
jgi:hypothetical protein